MVLKKFTSILNKRPAVQDDHLDNPEHDTPDANAARGVRLFCESGSANSGDEVLHLPMIVESAVATPTAAAAAAAQIRKFLSKDNLSRPHVQYNAIMLVRILADNPGPSFTKNMDTKFVDTVKSLLRKSQDPSVRQIMIETLNALEREKAYDTNMNELFAMWRKEQGLGASPSSFGPRTMNAPPWDPNAPNAGGSHRSHGRSKGLPTPVELAARIEEARTSAKLLLQLVQSTPPAELFSNDLIKEFAGRCQSAQRSIQGYINCDNPAPDDDTMLTLIETNEQLSLAASKHQRAVLQARRALGAGATPSPPLAGMAPPPGPPPHHQQGLGGISQAANDPPLPPRPIDNSNIQQPQQQYTNIPPIPQSLQPHQPYQPPPARPTQEDPFSDAHESYAPPAGPPPSSFSSRPSEPPYNQPPLPPAGPVPDTQRGGSPDSYHPGYHSTPSYIQRQESAGANLTMHGGALPPTTEAADEGTASATLSTLRSGGHHSNAGPPGTYREGDVSPVETRNGSVTYRY